MNILTLNFKNSVLNYEYESLTFEYKKWINIILTFIAGLATLFFGV